MGRGVVARDKRANWVWLSLIPMGLGAWAPAYAGSQMRNRRWLVLGIVWALIALAGWVVAIASHGGGAGGGLITIGWVGGIASSFVIRPAYLRALDSGVAPPVEAALADAERRLAWRERARKLSRDRPELAREVGVGRPDLPRAQSAGLVDVNNAPAAVLATLPGVDDTLATRIIEARAETHGFSSVEDLGLALDLDGNLVEELRDRVVFLPR